MFQSLLIKFSKNQGLWACAVVNEKGKYSPEKPARLESHVVVLPATISAAVEAWIHLAS